jgi:RNA polymerase sigma-70 factor, ECF subfamily
MATSALGLFTLPAPGALAAGRQGEPSAMRPVPDTQPAAQGSDDVDVRLARLQPAAAGGDAAAFRELVTILMPTLWRLASRMADDDAAAEDVVQIAIVKIWRSLASITDPRATRAFACATLRHVAIDAHRHAARRRTTSTFSIDNATTSLAEELVRAPPDANAVLESAEAKGLVRRALVALSDDHRMVLLLCDVDGVSHADAAVALGVRPGTIASRLSRARSALAREVRALSARPARRRFPFPWSQR